MTDQTETRPLRRFIAGAVCPQCRAVDRILLERDSGVDAAPRRRCVSCGYTDALDAPAVAEPSTRLGRSARPEGAAMPVRIVDPSGNPSGHES